MKLIAPYYRYHVCCLVTGFIYSFVMVVSLNDYLFKASVVYVCMLLFFQKSCNLCPCLSDESPTSESLWLPSNE